MPLRDTSDGSSTLSTGTIGTMPMVIDILRQRFGSRVQTNQSILSTHTHTLTYLPSQLPDVVVYAESTEEVSDIVTIAASHKVPIIPFGTGTSLEGGVNAPLGGISLDLSQMTKIVELHEEDMDIEVEAGLTRKSLNDHLRHHGLMFPIDPGADASLGGMAATRASGTTAVRYGTMRDNVLNVTAVMSDGSIIKTGNRARKSSSGYDLTRLLVGSEGTLGIITQLTLRLQPIPEHTSVGVAQFPSLESACNATISAMQMGLHPARIELLDDLMSKLLSDYGDLDLSPKATLFLEFHGTSAAVSEETNIMSEIISDVDGSPIEWLQESESRNALWRARHDAYHAAVQSRVGCKGVVTDACVPISRLADALLASQRDAKELNLIAPIVGHVGDGNFHITPLVMMEDSDEVSRAQELIDRLNRRTLEMDGTCTGEHGIGQGKRSFLELEHGSGSVIMSRIKLALDPDNIMNPGKVVSLEGEEL